jgi:hypothetical protein
MKGNSEMKALRALIIMLALSVCASAGDMPCEKTGDMPNDVAGEMHTGRTGEMDNGKTGDMPNEVTEIALNFLHSMLPLF